MDEDKNPETVEDKPVEARYEVFCVNCGEVFDACKSLWCECITDSPTLLCPHCNKCFCTASAQERKSFWDDAPPSLWQRRHKRGFRSAAELPGEEENPIRRPLILVADDEAATRRIAFRVIESLGYGVVLARDGAEAFDLAKKHMPDLILSDQMMPHMDGRNLCRKIKEDPETKGIIVVLMTGLYKKEAHRIEAIKEYRADDYLAKPIAFDKLGEILEAWLAPPKGKP